MPETTMISLDEALNILKRQLHNMRLPMEVIPVQQATGRVVVEDQFSTLDIPPFDKSAMDGYAVTADEEFSEYRVLETVAAGNVPTKKLEPGTATKIMTGAPVPKGTAKVIMIEKTSEVDGRMKIEAPETSVNICRKGEDIRCGDKILSAGTVLGPLEVANLISVGVTHVKVARSVRVAIFSTGDEIVDDPSQLTDGKIMDSNGPLLDALCHQYGFEVVSQMKIPDQLEATEAALRAGLEQADMLILSGGVSVGQFDFVTKAMEKIGLTIHFNRIAVVLTAARLMAGRDTEIPRVSLPLGFDFLRRKADRMGFIPCQLGRDGTLQRIEYHGTAHLMALLDCDGFFMVPKDVTSLSAGQKVDYVLVKGGFV